MPITTCSVGPPLWPSVTLVALAALPDTSNANVAGSLLRFWIELVWLSDTEPMPDPPPQFSGVSM